MICALCHREIVAGERVDGVLFWIHLTEGGESDEMANQDHAPQVPAELPEPDLECL
jgi:hypothetical protein